MNVSRIPPDAQSGALATAMNQVHEDAPAAAAPPGAELSPAALDVGPAYVLTPPDGYDSFDEYIRDWSAQNESKWKLPEPENCVRDRTGYGWLMGTTAVGRTKYSGAFDFFMSDDLAGLSDKEYAKLQHEFDAACNKARQNPHTDTISLRGCTMTMDEFEAMYDAMSQPYRWDQEILAKGTGSGLPLNSNWLIDAQSALMQLSTQKLLAEKGVSQDVQDLVMQRLEERADRAAARHGGHFDPLSEELYCRLLNIDVSTKAPNSRSFENTVSWFRDGVERAMRRDAALAPRACQIADSYARGLMETIRLFRLV